MVDKKKIRKLMKERGEQYYHDLFRMEKAMGIDLPEQVEDDLRLLGISMNSLGVMLRHMSAKQIINRTVGYSGAEGLSDDLCGRALSHIRETAQMYADYISMRAALGYDMGSLIIQHPRNLEEEHHRMVVETNAEEAKIKIRTKNEQYPEIGARYGELCEMYQYENGEFSIRPAKNAGEIVEEGLALHHCVGGDIYLSSHAEGRSIILLLRPAQEKRVPFVTVEIKGYSIRQWYGVYNTKPMQKKINKWLDRYVEILKSGITGTGTAGGTEGIA